MKPVLKITIHISKKYTSLYNSNMRQDQTTLTCITSNPEGLKTNRIYNKQKSLMVNCGKLSSLQTIDRHNDKYTIWKATKFYWTTRHLEENLPADDDIPKYRSYLYRVVPITTRLTIINCGIGPCMSGAAGFVEEEKQ